MSGKSDRYFVPDLTPMDREELRGIRFRFVFVAESPHVSEVEAKKALERRPLCGAAGKVWWGALSEIIDESRKGELTELSAKNLLGFCARYRIAVMNAVRFPLDPKIVDRVKDSAADPVLTLGFSKAAGATHYRKAPVAVREHSVGDLRKRLLDPSIAGARVIALGNDADWFIAHALSEQERENRRVCKIAHPSAWWRKGGYFGKQARKTLVELFS